MFPESIISSVFYLRDLYKNRKNCVVLAYPIIEIIKFERNTEFSVKLFYYPGSNTLEIQPPDYKYFNKISFFDYRRPENRWTRNKAVLTTIINDLRRCELWDLVSNKDFLVINPNNDRVAEDKRTEELKKILK